MKKVMILILLFLVTSCKEYVFENSVDTNIAIHAPTGLTITFSADTMATVSWQYNNYEKYSFTVELSDDGSSWSKFGEISGNNNIQSAYNFLVNKSYSFRVKANSDQNQSSYISTQAQITTLGAPTELAVTFPTDTKAVLTWKDNSTIETGFEIEMSSDGTNYVLIKNIGANSTTIEVEGIYSINTNYYFRIRAKSTNNYSGYSNIAISGIKPFIPTLISPLNNSTDQPISLILSWDASSGAVSYTLQVSTSNSFSSYVFNQDGLTNTSQQISGLSNLTDYYWRVSATNNFGTSNVSEIWRFTTTGITPIAPTLLSPSYGAINQSITPTLSWNASSGAVSYTLQVSVNINFNSYIYNQAGLTNTSQLISGLSNLTDYYWRVSATNSDGTSGWSSVWSFTTTSGSTAGTPCPGIPTLTYKGKTYNTVQIGSQCWLKENLDVGTMIQVSQKQTNNGSIEKYCYNNDVSNCATYGGLYQWAETVQYKNGATNTSSPNPAFSGNVQGICPIGWHIPTRSEFETLSAEVYNNSNALKAVGQGSGSGAGTNSSGFSALLAGFSDLDSYFFYLGTNAFFMSTTENGSNFAHFMILNNNYSNVEFANGGKYVGCSVRCVKDESGNTPPSVPTLLSPSNAATGQSTSPTLSWNTSTGATSYTLQVSANSSFTSFIYNQSALTNTSQQISSLNNLTQYYWRVSGTNSDGTSGWSSVWSFTTTGTAPSAPTLISPLNNSVDQSITPTLSWNAVSGATSYTLQVSTSSSFGSYVYNQSGLTGTSQQISVLNNLTQYYWRVSATNSFGTSTWSSVWSFTTIGSSFLCGSQITYAGKTYNTVQIGNQCWLKENLDVGVRINGSQDQTNNGTIEKYCYSDDANNCTSYGGLYQWAEAVQYKNGATNTSSPNPAFSGNVQGICPTGWHIPTISELETLSTAVNGNSNSLKAVGQGSSSGAGTNVSGFSALLAGYRTSNGYFYDDDVGGSAYFWSSTEGSIFHPYFMSLRAGGSNIDLSDGSKPFGFSVRCLKD